MADRVAFAWEGAALSGAWHRGGGRTCVVLAHGAGGTLDTPGLSAYADALAAAGVDAVRFNFPYAEAKRRVPDPRVRLVAAYRAVAEQVASSAGEIYAGGRSMGGRIASHLAAEGFPLRGLVFLAYPLHPPRQPHLLRTAHLGAIAVPMLFLQGSRDAFARMDLLRPAVAALPAATLHVIEGADHSFRVAGRSPAEVVQELAGATVDWMADKRK